MKETTKFKARNQVGVASGVCTVHTFLMTGSYILEEQVA